MAAWSADARGFPGGPDLTGDSKSRPVSKNFPQGLKARLFFVRFAARLKSSPFKRRDPSTAKAASL